MTFIIRSIDEFFANIPEDDNDLFDCFYFRVFDYTTERMKYNSRSRKVKSDAPKFVDSSKCPICDKKYCDHEIKGEGNLISRCASCGDLFLAHRRSKRYCSARCRRRAYNNYSYDRSSYCVVCGVEITGNRHKLYCSIACKRAAYHKRKNRQS